MENDDSLRTEARRRLEERRGFSTHVVAYVLVNALLVLIWATTGHGYFWPAWVLGGWGIGLVMHLWNAFIQKPITSADVDREMRKLGRG